MIQDIDLGYSISAHYMQIKKIRLFFNLHIVYMRITNHPHIHFMRINNYPHIHYMRIKPTYKFEDLTQYPVGYSQLKRILKTTEQLCSTQLSSLVLCMSQSTDALVITQYTTLHHYSLVCVMEMNHVLSLQVSITSNLN